MSDLARLNIVINSSDARTAASNLNLLTSSSRGVEDSFNRLYGLAIKLAGGFTLLKAAQIAFSQAASWERAEAAFTIFLRDAEKARNLMDQLKSFSVKTPFEFTTLASAAQRLLLIGTSADQVLPKVRALSQAASLIGTSPDDALNRLINAFAQIQGKNRVSAEEMTQQLGELIPGWQFLAKAIGVDVPKAMKLAENGSLDAGQTINAMLGQMEEFFQGGLEKGLETLGGSFRYFVKTVETELGEAGEALNKTFGISEKLQKAAEEVRVFSSLISDTIRIILGMPPAIEANAAPANFIIDVLQKIGIALGILLGIKFVGIMQSWVTSVLGLSKALLGLLPVISAVIGIILAFRFGAWLDSNFGLVQETAADLIRIVSNTWAWLKSGFTQFFSYIKEALAALINDALDKLALFFQGIGKIESGARSLLSGLGFNVSNQSPQNDIQNLITDLDKMKWERKGFGNIYNEGLEKFNKEKAENDLIYENTKKQIRLDDSSREDRSFTDFLGDDLDNVYQKLSEMMEKANNKLGIIENPDFSKWHDAVTNELKKLNDIKITPLEKFDPSKIIIQNQQALEKGRAKLQDMLGDLQAELETVGKTAEQRERILKTHRLEEEVAKYGLKTDEQGIALKTKYLEQLDKLESLRKVAEIADEAGNKIAGAFEDAIFNAKDLSAAVKALGQDLLRLVFQQTITKTIANTISGGINGLFGGILGGGSSAIGSTTTPLLPNGVGDRANAFALGAAFYGGRVTPFAQGDVFNSPTYFGMRGGAGVMGEAGPEAVMPLKRGKDGRLGVAGGGGTQVINVNVSGVSNVDEFRRSAPQIANQIRKLTR